MRLHLRWDSLLAAVTLASSVALLDLPLGAGIPLSILGLYQLLLAVPNAAIRLERLDGRAWTIPICRDYRFDASLAFMDAEQHRDALRAVRSDDPSPRRND